MSVLYKALAKAAKAREALRPEPEVQANPRLVGRAKGGKRLRLVLVAIAGSLALGVGGLAFFGDDILSTLDQLQEAVGNGPPLPGPIGVRRPVHAARPAPALSPAKLPNRPPPPSTAVAVPSSSVAVVPPPTPAAPAGSAPAAAPAPPLPPPVVAASLPPAASPAQPSKPAAGKPAASAASPSQMAAAPSQPATPPVVAGVSMPPPGAPAAPPAPTAPTAPTSPQPPAKAIISLADQDLPAIMDRIRREKARPAIAQAVTVDRRAGNADLTGADGEPAVTVSVSMPPEREDAKSAYDMLLHGRYDAALDLYDKALKASPTSLPLLLGKATALHKLRRFHDAREAYSRVLAADPDNREALTNMTAIVAAQAPQQALDELRDLQRAYPSFSPIPAQIAAIAALDQAIALSPENGLYRLNLAILEDRAGMRSEAAASYQAAIDLLGPGSSLPLPLEQIRRRLMYLQGR